MDYMDYREKLGIGFSDKQKTGIFRSKLNASLSAVEQYLKSNSYIKVDFIPYFVAVGETPRFSNYYTYDFLVESIIEAPTILDMLSKFVMFINVADKCLQINGIQEILKNHLIAHLNQTHILFDVIEDADGIFIFPKGAKQLDDALISEPLEWLKGYPSAHTAWIKALKDYANATEDTASDVADKFRKALEAFFQEFFGGSKSLENYKSEYGSYLKRQGVPKEISGNFEALLQSYTQFMNNYAKHRDATSDKTLEYIMYQTGNMIRLLITLKQTEK